MVARGLTRSAVLAWAALFGLVGWAGAQPTLTPEQLRFFESKIRPVLVESCYKCHSEQAKKVRGGLLVDSREGLLRGGDSGPAIVPGQPDKSLLIQAIRYHDESMQMPPKNAGGKLPAQVIRDFEKWVRDGAPDPRQSTVAATPKAPKPDPRSWWAFQPLQQPTAPAVQEATWPLSDLDRFVLHKLEQQGLRPVGDAEPLVLLRRLYYDLIGLPPTPTEAQQFLADWKAAADKQAALAAVVDRLLASPQFGERWGRHWLDVARYAESTGKDVNFAYPHAWRYRDYVIQAFNNDMPFNQFVREQMAGDLLPAASEQDRARLLIATGFLALGPKSLDEMNPRQFAVDVADEQIDTFSQAFLGITIACARCHDHKFDPISQREYTAVAGIFLSTETRYGTSGALGGRNRGDLLELPTSARLPIVAKGMTAEERRRKEEQLEQLRAEARELFAQPREQRQNARINILRVTTRINELENELDSCHEDGTPKALCMGVRDKPATVSARERFGRGLGPGMGPGPGRRPGFRQSGFETVGDSPLFARGEITSPGERVPRAVPTFLSSVSGSKIPASASGRLQLADWLVDARNPLTRRVIVNRIWHWLFGRGLVASVDNFGTTGDQPSHPELLDYLAQQFAADGWSIKKMVRRIVLSRTYQLAATFDEKKFAADPDNALLWRHTPRRLDAEAIRDGILYAAGTLKLTPPVGSLIAEFGDGPIGGPRVLVISEERLTRAESPFRSVYLPSARNVGHEFLELFDLPDAAAPEGARPTTNVPSQALFFLNSDFITQQATHLARKLVERYPGSTLAQFDQRFELACWLILNRPPRQTETAAARKLVQHNAKDAVAAWTRVVRGLFASAEFRQLD